MSFRCPVCGKDFGVDRDGLSAHLRTCSPIRLWDGVDRAAASPDPTPAPDPAPPPPDKPWYLFFEQDLVWVNRTFGTVFDVFWFADEDALIRKVRRLRRNWRR